MNNFHEIRKGQYDERVYEFGLSSLHKWIRFMECVLHVSYRMAFMKWAAKTTEQKESMKLAKEDIQQKLRSELDLIVDVPKQGSGSSNDGNTARTFFRNFKTVSSITGFDENLLKRMYVLLQVMASGRYFDTDLFRDYALGTAEQFVNKYSYITYR